MSLKSRADGCSEMGWAQQARKHRGQLCQTALQHCHGPASTLGMLMQLPLLPGQGRTCRGYIYATTPWCRCTLAAGGIVAWHRHHHATAAQLHGMTTARHDTARHDHSTTTAQRTGSMMCLISTMSGWRSRRSSLISRRMRVASATEGQT